MTTTIEVYSITKGTEVNGPGTRNMVHVQGCTLGCVGCFNAKTWPKETALSNKLHINTLANLLLEGDPDGITISGGEPLQQAEPVITLINTLREASPSLHILLFTGYTEEEVESLGLLDTLRKLSDIIVFGRFEQGDLIPQPHSELRGSRNQTVYYKEDRSGADPLIGLEFHIEPDKVRLTGFPGKSLIKSIKKELGGV